jgi:PKD repeat protein
MRRFSVLILILLHFTGRVYSLNTNECPTISFTVSEKELCKSEALLFTAFYTGGFGEAKAYEWDFGDGHIEVTQSSSIGYLYGSPGLYTVSLSIIFDNGCTQKVTIKNAVSIYGYNAYFEADDHTPTTGQTVVFTFKGDATGSTNYVFDFGDGSPSESGSGSLAYGSTFTHVYTTGGFLKPTLTLIGPNCSDTQGTDFHVSKCPTVALYSEPSVTCLGKSVGLYPVISSESPDSKITEIAWNLGNGTQVVQTGATFYPYTYSSAGSYTVTATVTFDNGCQATISRLVTILEIESNFTASPLTVGVGSNTTITFTGLANGANFYTLNFGDGSSQIGGSISPGNQFTHSYAAPGIYEVSLYIESTETEKTGAIAPITIPFP